MISVAIDGPSGAGKSSLAKRLAADMGFTYVDTGAMYRSIGLYVVRQGKDPHDAAAWRPCCRKSTWIPSWRRAPSTFT